MVDSRAGLKKYAWLSIAAAVVTISMKMVAWRMTGSVGLLSDAAESVTNLAAAIMALLMLRVAARPPDDDHQFGHDKAEYFSAAVEGMLIFVAAVLIIISATQRLLHPQPLEDAPVGAVIATLAAAVNGTVGSIMIRAGKKHRSPTLDADGKHLWTDVVTSVGVVVAIILVIITDWNILDPIIAFVVGANIIVTGVKLVRDSTKGLMDVTLPDEENQVIAKVLASFSDRDVLFHGLRTRLSGSQRFAVVDILVPGQWTVARSHDLIEEVEDKMQTVLPGIEMQIHLEPKEDPRAYGDYEVEVPIPQQS
ncbi:MAG: cation diffusion facilitator family transporter [Propionibacteriaceae bacterium]|nr:cation diffusion facilitator family transporter [Propionibacteriaceae bacterium]